ncbi:hypothetical protein J3A83DRAFT_4187399 [Scleroderma citrinum]
MHMKGTSEGKRRPKPVGWPWRGSAGKWIWGQADQSGQSMQSISDQIPRDPFKAIPEVLGVTPTGHFVRRLDQSHGENCMPSFLILLWDAQPTSSCDGDAVEPCVSSKSVNLDEINPASNSFHIRLVNLVAHSQAEGASYGDHISDYKPTKEADDLLFMIPGLMLLPIGHFTQRMDEVGFSRWHEWFSGHTQDRGTWICLYDAKVILPPSQRPIRHPVNDANTMG